MSEENRGRPDEYDDALAEAVDHVAHTLEAQKEAEGLRSRKWYLPGLMASLIAFALVAAWNVWLITRPTPMLSPRLLEGGLRYEVGQLVREIEAHRAEHGTLPTPEDLAPFLDEIVGYTLDGGEYVVSVRHDGVSLTYDGSVPIDRWMAETGDER